MLMKLVSYRDYAFYPALYYMQTQYMADCVLHCSSSQYSLIVLMLMDTLTLQTPVLFILISSSEQSQVASTSKAVGSASL